MGSLSGGTESDLPEADRPEETPAAEDDDLPPEADRPASGLSAEAGLSPAGSWADIDAAGARSLGGADAGRSPEVRNLCSGCVSDETAADLAVGAAAGVGAVADEGGREAVPERSFAALCSAASRAASARCAGMGAGAIGTDDFDVFTGGVGTRWATGRVLALGPCAARVGSAEACVAVCKAVVLSSALRFFDFLPLLGASPSEGALAAGRQAEQPLAEKRHLLQPRRGRSPELQQRGGRSSVLASLSELMGCTAGVRFWMSGCGRGRSATVATCLAPASPAPSVSCLAFRLRPMENIERPANNARCMRSSGRLVGTAGATGGSVDGAAAKEGEMMLAHSTSGRSAFLAGVEEVRRRLSFGRRSAMLRGCLNARDAEEKKQT